MAEETKVDFDFERFKQLVAHFDNGNQGERSNAFRAVMKMCEKDGRHFCDIAKDAYGNADTGELEEARSQIADLEAQIRSYADASQEFERRAEEISNENAELRYENEQLRNAEQSNPGEDVKAGEEGISWIALFRRWLPSLSWSWPSALTLALGAVIAASWIWGQFSMGTFPVLLLYSARWVLFVAGAVVVYRMEGARVVLIKAALWVAGWYAVVLIITNLWPWGFSASATRGLFVPWLWVTPVMRFSGHEIQSLAIALIVLAGIVAANLSPFSAWLGGREKESV
jgi:hypothetical protein